MAEAVGKRRAQTFFMQRSAVPGALVPCLQAEQLPVLRRLRSPKFFSLFAHKGGDRQWSVVELPVTGEGASLPSIGALVLKGAFLSPADRSLKALCTFWSRSGSLHGAACSVLAEQRRNEASSSRAGGRRLAVRLYRLATSGLQAAEYSSDG